MIRPKKNTLIHWFFHHYILWIVGRNFHEFKFNKAAINPNKAVLLLANHFSWWDGFLMYCLNHELIGKKFHIMILEDTVRKVSFLKYMGAFSINKNSRDMVTSLNYAADLLRDPENLVLIFPQGKLYSNFINDVDFQKGLMRVVSGAQHNFDVLFAATFIEYFQYKKPTVSVYVNNGMESASFKNMDDLTLAYKQYYTTARQQQTDIVI